MKNLTRHSILIFFTFFFFGKNANAQIESCTVDTICQNSSVNYLLDATYVIPLSDFPSLLGLLDFTVINTETIELNYEAFVFGLDTFKVAVGAIDGSIDTLCFEILVEEKLPLEYYCCKEFSTSSDLNIELSQNTIGHSFLEAPNNGSATFEVSMIGNFINYSADSLWTGIDSFIVQSFPDVLGITFPVTNCYIIEVTEETTSISKIPTKEIQFSIFPNPSSSVFSYKIESSEKVNLNHLAIFDSRGRKVFEEKNPSIAEDLDLTNFAKGIYFLQIQTGKELITKKIIKQ